MHLIDYPECREGCQNQELDGQEYDGNRFFEKQHKILAIVEPQRVIEQFVCY